VLGLPRSGEVRIEGRIVAPGAAYSVDRFATATYKPTGSAQGDVGTFDFLVDDGRGGNTLGSLSITVTPSNRPPVAEPRRRLRIYTGAIGIVPPTDPDGDRLAVTVQALPRGLVRFGLTPIRVGDRLQPEQLPVLVYVPEPGFSGPAGSFQYLVDDGRGGRTEGTLDIDVMDPVEAATQMAEAAVWERLGSTGRLEDVETFMRLYPTSYLAPTAQRRRDELMAQQRQPSRARHKLRLCASRELRRRRSNRSRPKSWRPCSRSRRRPTHRRSNGGTSRWRCRLSLLRRPLAQIACSRTATLARPWCGSLLAH
jgi:hypothetical protein